MIETPHIVQTDAQPTAVVHLTVARNEIQQVMGPAIADVMAAVSAQGLKPVGPVFSYHLSIRPDIFDFEVGVPVSGPFTPAGRVKPSHLPSAKVARTVYIGPYEGLGDGWGEFKRWITAQGLAGGPPLWERYVAGPESSPDPAQWRTELNLPLV